MNKERDLDILPVMHSSFPVAPFDDITEGPGIQVRIGESQAQIFPGTRAARAELAGDRARMTNVSRIAIEDDALNLYGETEDHHTALRLDSESLVFAKQRKPQTVSSASEDAVTDRQGAVEGSESSDLPDTASNGGKGNDAEQTPVRERVDLTGRIGYAPRFRETPKGTLVGSFSLAVHAAPGDTSWHKIVTFGARAQKLKDSALGKGDEVEIVGYTHERDQIDSKTGETKTMTEIYAAVVKRPKDKEGASPKESSGEAD